MRITRASPSSSKSAARTPALTRSGAGAPASFDRDGWARGADRSPRPRAPDPRCPSAPRASSTRAMEMPLRCSAGRPAQGAGSPGSQVGGRGITWGGTGRDIDLTLTAGAPARRRRRGRVASLRSRPVTSPVELQAQADALQWYHSIDLGNGVVTRGTSVQETSADVIPDVSGRSVLDIGAWDGKFSFLAERAGASRVVALDHYAWGVDWAARGAYWEECIQRTARSPTSRATRRTSGCPTSRDAVPSTSPRPRSARRWSRWWPTSRRRPRRARAVRRGALPRRALPHEGAADLPRAGARASPRRWR